MAHEQIPSSPNAGAGVPPTLGSTAQTSSPASSTLAVELSGKLPCFRCSYDLRGLSITANCPECGSPVRATLVQVIDPSAKELAPLRAPKLATWGIILWAAGGTLACALFLFFCVLDWVNASLVHAGSPLGRFSLALCAWLMLGGCLLSMLAALCTVRPLRSDAWSVQTMMPLLAACAYVPLLAQLYALVVQGHGWSFIKSAWLQPRLLLALCAIVILLCMRPTVRLLAARAWMLTSKPKDRQTTMSLAIVIAAGALAQTVLAAASGTIDPILDRLLAQVLMLLTLLLLTMGLLRLSFDLLRMRARIEQGLAPAQSLVPRRTGPSAAIDPQASPGEPTSHIPSTQVHPEHPQAKHASN